MEKKSLKVHLAIWTILLLAGSTLFSVASFTGYAVSGVEFSEYNWIGAVMFLAGIVVAWFYLRNK